MRVWRLCSRRWTDTAFSGRGAAENPGRWNSFGRRAVYCAESRALAALEVLAHVENKRRLRHVRFVAIPVDIPDALVQRPTRFPRQWNVVPAPAATRVFGDRALGGKFPALRVPSAVVAEEFCVVLNPAHPRFAEIKIGEPESFSFDERVVSGPSRPKPAG